MKLSDRVARAGLDHPETFRRIRFACGDQDCSPIDLNAHASRITLDVVEARANPRAPRRVARKVAK